MFEARSSKKVWLIDRRDYWREPFARALRRDGFEVVATGDYLGLPELERRTGPPDLVVLVCTVAAVAEQGLVRLVAQHGHYVLVLVAVLPPAAMRELFLAGAFDVQEMPSRIEGVVTLVEGALEEVRSSREHKVAAIAGLR